MSKFDTDMQCEEVYGTFKGEPASEDGWTTEWHEGAAIGEGSFTPEEELQPWQRNLRADWLANG